MTSFSHTPRFGASLTAPDQTLFTLWAPSSPEAFVDIKGLPPLPMQRAADGTFTAEAPCGAGTLYTYRVQNDLTVPDPASRFQPEGTHGPSEVIDPRAYTWKTPNWKGLPWEEIVLYETHVGLEGNYSGMKARLQELKDLGITAIELMPLNTFAGQWNWGYDGVLPYAPSETYGHPDDLKDLIDTAHGMGMTVFIDIVYNHFGPDGNYLPEYAKDFFDPDYQTAWGAGIHFKNPHVADFFIDNALMWLMEYRFDGLRIDAAWAITDRNWFYKLQTRIKETIEPDRQVHVILENENNDSGLLRDGYSAQWYDDWHHTMTVLLSGEDTGTFQYFSEDPTALMRRILAEGFAWQGEYYPPQKKNRGTSSKDLPPTKFVTFLHNHDQIGNRPKGDRLLTNANPEAFKAAYALLLLSPAIPMLFLGDEWGSTTPFYFFCNHTGEIGEMVRKGREDQYADFYDISDPELLKTFPSPTDRSTYENSAPTREERASPYGQSWLALTKSLLTTRHAKLTPHLKNTTSAGTDILAPKALLARWTLGDGSLLTIAINLGKETPSLPELHTILHDTRPDSSADTLPPNSIVVSLGR